jgi:SPP1 gp7 family putative phage head morphogenesis protein
MKKSDIAIADEILSNAIRIERFTASEKKKLFKVFLQMQTELKAKLASGFTPYEKTRLTKLLKDCTAIINTFYGGIQSEFDYVGLVKAEAAATQTAIASIGLEASLPSAAVLKAMVSDSLIQGAPLKDWWEKMGADTAFKFAAQVRQGVVAGETLQQVIMRIVGSKKKGIVGIMEISHRHASTLVHDSIMQIANDARMAVYKANADIMKGFEWLSTLDSNTCVSCMAYSGAQWDMEGKPIKGNLPLQHPPQHPNCRCVLTPLTKSYKELGLNISEMPVGTRASDEGQVKADMSFSEFLGRKTVEQQDEMLGKGRAELWRKKIITLNQLLDFTGKPLTLKQLSARIGS